MHQVEADSPAQADEVARIRADAVNAGMQVLGHGTAWAPTVVDLDSEEGGLDDIVRDAYLLDEVDGSTGYVPLDESPVFELLLAWRDAAVKAATPPVQRWLLTAVGESMTHEGSFADACALAERSWIARNGEDGGALAWSRLGDSGAWELLHQEADGGFMPTLIRVRAR